MREWHCILVKCLNTIPGDWKQPPSTSDTWVKAMFKIDSDLTMYEATDEDDEEQSWAKYPADYQKLLDEIEAAKAQRKQMLGDMGTYNSANIMAGTGRGGSQDTIPFYDDLNKQIPILQEQVDDWWHAEEAELQTSWEQALKWPHI